MESSAPLCTGAAAATSCPPPREEPEAFIKRQFRPSPTQGSLFSSAMLRLSIWLFLLVRAVVAVNSCGAARAEESRRGFDVNFWRYPVLSEEAWNDDTFFESGYRKFGYVGLATGVTDTYLRQRIEIPEETPVQANVYGQLIDVTNFTMILTGYFYASTTGRYSFTYQADEGGSFQFGSAQGHCCGNPYGDVSQGIAINQIPEYPGQFPTGTTNAIFDLVEGNFYPVRIMYFNFRQSTLFNAVVELPNGVTADIGSQVYQLELDPDESLCYTTVTTYWDGPGTSTTTASGTSINTVIVEIPKSTTTVTTYWDEPGTSTTTQTGPSVNTVVVEIPKSTTTVTTYWDEPGTSTTTQTGSSVNTVVVEVPKLTTTVTSTWENSYASSSTATGTVTNTVFVNVPIPTTTVTTAWTGSYTTTTTITGGPGETNTVLVQTPEFISEVAPSSSSPEVVPSSSEIAPSSSSPEVVPSSSEIAPSSSESAPSSSEIAPSSSTDLIPSSSSIDFIPSSAEIAPSSSSPEVVPSSSEIAPSFSDIASSSSEIAPLSSEIAPSSSSTDLAPVSSRNIHSGGWNSSYVVPSADPASPVPPAINPTRTLTRTSVTIIPHVPAPQTHYTTINGSPQNGNAGAGHGDSGVDNSGDSGSGSGNANAGAGSGNPGAGNPGAGNPGAGNPGAGNPGAGNPGAGNPGAGNSGAGNSGSGNSGSGNSGAGNSGAGNSGSGNSGAGSGNSGSGNAGSGNSGAGSGNGSPNVQTVAGGSRPPSPAGSSSAAGALPSATVSIFEGKSHRNSIIIGFIVAIPFLSMMF